MTQAIAADATMKRAMSMKENSFASGDE